MTNPGPIQIPGRKKRHEAKKDEHPVAQRIEQCADLGRVLVQTGDETVQQVGGRSHRHDRRDPRQIMNGEKREAERNSHQ